MSAPNASSSSQLISYTQDIYYTKTEGFKQFKVCYNVKNAQATHNNPRGAYLTVEAIYQAVKGLGCTLWTFDGLSLDNFITSGSVSTRHCLKHLSLVSSDAIFTRIFCPFSTQLHFTFLTSSFSLMPIPEMFILLCFHAHEQTIRMLLVINRFLATTAARSPRPTAAM